MPDRIYATYTPTKIPGAFHTAIHYERRDAAGNLLDHTVLEARPEKYDELGSPDNVDGIVGEAQRTDDRPSRFGIISANVRPAGRDDLDAPHEIIAESDDLGESLARMKLFAQGVNRAGFAYRGYHQNSNTFASAALQAGNLPPATGVARDPRGKAGELLEFFAPGLNQPLQRPIGPESRSGVRLEPHRPPFAESFTVRSQSRFDGYFQRRAHQAESGPTFVLLFAIDQGPHQPYGILATAISPEKLKWT